MTLFRTADEERIARGLGAIAHANPFRPERLELERGLLGDRALPPGTVWHRGGPEIVENAELLAGLSAELTESLLGRLEGVRSLDRPDRSLVRDVFLHHLYHRHLPDLRRLVREPASAIRPLGFWTDFRTEAERLFGHPALDHPDSRMDPAHLLAAFYQLRRAFQHVFQQILGGTAPAARLRAEVWESIFTHDMRRYRRGLFDRMRHVTTLVTGPSGTGKELVGRAIALSGYVPFDPVRSCFLLEEENLFRSVHLAAFSPTLVEAELFGARKGAYTGADEDRDGWLASVPEWGSVFLDEIGEIETGLQVKLLRLLQTRRFSRLGETVRRSFEGRILAATNRSLEDELESGGLREDFVYRLCGDRIETPSLAEQLREDPDELGPLLELLAERFLDADEAVSVAGETFEWIRASLPADYPWPGNFRELEQCLRNVLVHRAYRPPRRRFERPDDALDRALAPARWTADELVDRYCALAVEATGSFSAAGRRLELDRRTVRSRSAAHRKRSAERPPDSRGS